MTRIRDLVKTYKLINDPDAPSWNVRFIGAIAAVGAIALAALALLSWSPPLDAPDAGAGDGAAAVQGGESASDAGDGEAAPLNATVPSTGLGLPP